MPLSETDVRLILTSPLGCRRLSRQLGCAEQTISGIRNGKTHTTVCPELPRRQAEPPQLTCKACVHWLHNRCGMEFPEAEIIGTAFAQECATFSRKNRH
jgi:hypothetical protein